MIDWNKLKQAHELCLKSGYSFSFFFGGKDIRKMFGKDIIEPNWTIYDIESGPILFEGEDVNELIDKLQELMQPRPKYEIGQKVYLKNVHNIIFQAIITEWNGKEIYLIDRYNPDDDSYENFGIHESCLFPTKESLIQAQIEYWQKLKYEQEPCQHEPNKKLHICNDSDGKKVFKCNCGEYFKEEPCQHESAKIWNDGSISIFKCAKCGEYYK